MGKGANKCGSFKICSRQLCANYAAGSFGSTAVIRGTRDQTDALLSRHRVRIAILADLDKEDFALHFTEIECLVESVDGPTIVVTSADKNDQARPPLAGEESRGISNGRRMSYCRGGLFSDVREPRQPTAASELA